MTILNKVKEECFQEQDDCDIFLYLCPSDFGYKDYFGTCLWGYDINECEECWNRELEDGMIKDEWCTDCKEYDQENHCCHRWTKCIRNTVAELKEYYGFHPIEEKPDEQKDYVVQFKDGRFAVKYYDMDNEVFCDAIYGFSFAAGEEHEKPIGAILCTEPIVAWARLPERYKGRSTYVVEED